MNPFGLLKLRDLCFGLFLLLFLLNNRPLFAQKYPYKLYNIRDGLSNMQCLSVFQDSRGFVWITTKNGLNRFDGQNFKKYYIENGLEHNSNFSNLIELPTKEICFLNSRYLFFFDNTAFRKIKLPETLEAFDSKHSLFYNPIKHQIVIIANDGMGLGKSEAYVFDLAKKVFFRLTFPRINNELAFSPKYFDLEDFKFIGLGVKHDAKFEHVYKYGEAKYAKIFDNYNGAGTGFDYSNEDQVVLSMFNSQSQTVFYIKEKKKPSKPWFLLNLKGDIELINAVESSQLIVFGGNVYFIQANSLKLELVHQSVGQGSGGITSKDGKLMWMPTEKGLIQFINNGIRYFDEKEAEYIWAVGEDNRKNIWLLPYGTPLRVFDGVRLREETKHKQLFPFAMADNQTVDIRSSNFFYFSAPRDKHGVLWLPNATCQIKYQDDKFERVNNMPAFYNFYDQENDYIFQGSNKGILAFPTTAPSKTFFLEGGKDLISYNNYMYIYKDRKKRYWLGGWGGMNRFENIADIFKKKSKEYSKEKQNIPFKGFITMFEDVDNTLWIGTVDGLFYYDELHDKFIQVMANQIKKFVTIVGEVTSDKLIVGVEEGLMILDQEKLKSGKPALLKLYNYYNGFEGLEPGQNGLFKDSQGRLWITSGSVLSYMESDKLDLANDQLIPYFDKINQTQVMFDSNRALKLDENAFHIEVGANGFNRPKETQYSLVIDDEHWSPWQKSYEFFIAALSNGKHTLKLRAKTDGIVETDLRPAVLTLNISAPFYKSPNFSFYLGTICSLLIGLILVSIVRARLALQKLREKEKQINYLQIQTLQAQLNPHFLFNALSSLQHLILKKETVLANNSLTRLASLMRSYLESSVMANNPRVRKNEISLRHKIELLNSYLDLENIQHEDKFGYRIEASPDLPLDSIKFPPLIIQPFVENAIKHGLVHKKGKGSLIIKFEQKDEALICTIDDDGIGRKAAAEIKRKSEYSYKSYGTHLVHERVKLLNESDYEIDIQTIDKPQGTTVIIKIQQKYED
jgi:two-component sensor histidine kinase